MTAGRGELGRGEWPATLEVGRLASAGWRPIPFREFVLKIHSRCDLACDYCYMYDDGGPVLARSRHSRMSQAIVDQAAARIAEHARAHDLPSGRVRPARRRAAARRPRVHRHAVSVRRRALPPQVQARASPSRPTASASMTASSTSSGDSGSGSASASTATAVLMTGTAGSRTARAATRRVAAALRRLEPGLPGGVRRPAVRRRHGQPPVATYEALRGSARQRSISCCRTATGRHRRPAGPRTRRRHRTLTG